MRQRITIEGRLFCGKGQGAFFTQLDWVKAQISEKMGFEPFPGTVNIKVPKGLFSLLREMGKGGKRLIPPVSNFCEAGMVKAKIGEWDAAAIFPSEEVWAYTDTLELVLPICLRDELGLQEGDKLRVEVERSFEPKAVIFDLDGTLIDSLGVYLEVINEVLHRLGLPKIQKGVLKEVMAWGEDPWEVFISDEAGGNRDELVARCKEFNKEIFSPTYKAKAKLFPGVIKTLEALNNKGLKLGGITSGLDKHKIHEVFKREGASALLSEIVSRQDVASSKPAPDLLEECSQRLGIPSFESVCVGDTPLDIRMAKGAGAAAVGVLSGVGTREQLVRESPDAIVEDVSGLIPVLEAC